MRLVPLFAYTVMISPYLTPLSYYEVQNDFTVGGFDLPDRLPLTPRIIRLA
jgi:hypothetical protein